MPKKGKLKSVLYFSKLSHKGIIPQGDDTCFAGERFSYSLCSRFEPSSRASPFQRASLLEGFRRPELILYEDFTRTSGPEKFQYIYLTL